jgi:hypothetical protein
LLGPHSGQRREKPQGQQLLRLLSAAVVIDRLLREVASEVLVNVEMR